MVGNQVLRVFLALGSVGSWMQVSQRQSHPLLVNIAKVELCAGVVLNGGLVKQGAGKGIILVYVTVGKVLVTF